MTASADRRQLGTALLLCVLGAVAVLLATGQPWTSLELPVGVELPVVPDAPLGRAVAPLATGLGVVGLAGAAALVATRGALRRLVGVLLAVAGLTIVVDAVRAGRAGADDLTLIIEGEAARQLVGVTTGWSWLAVAGGVAIAVAGLLAVVRSQTWPTMSRRYEAPAAAGPTAAAAPSRPSSDHGGAASAPDADEAWRALDRGEDPTA